MSVTVLGKGLLSWERGERVSDRYGFVGLIDTEKDEFEPFDSDLLQKLENRKGKLVVEVTGTRDSHHIGDFFRGLFPVTPEVGERIVLGEGEFTFWEGSEYEDGFRHVGLLPDDERDSDWLDPEMLYRAHDQDVILSFEEEA